MKGLFSVKGLALAFSAVLVGAFIIGYLLVNEKDAEKLQRPEVNETAQEEPKDSGDDTMTNYVSQPTTTTNTRLIFKTLYSECGHTVLERQAISNRMTGLTRSQILQHYPDWEIESFQGQEVVFYRRMEGACPGHYLLKEQDGYITIYRTGEEGELELIRMTDIVVSILRFRDQQRLRDGILLDDMEEVNRYLEDLGS